MEQYKDFWHRAHRLEPAHRAYLGAKPAPIHLVTNEDMCLYLNWMCWKFSSTEKINNFIMVVLLLTNSFCIIYNNLVTCFYVLYPPLSEDPESNYLEN